MGLFERGKISSDIIEGRIAKLEEEKTAILDAIEGDNQYRAAIDYAESELNNDVIKEYAENFETLLDESNTDIMREFIKTFIRSMEIFGKENGKKRGRKILIHSQIPALSGIKVASPRGVEPLLQE